MKLNADFQAFAATHFNANQYVASPAYGVNRFLLDRIGDEKARATTIVEYKPNSKFPEHQHIGGEEFLVLKGTFHDQFGSFPAGTYVRNPVDSVHAPWVEDDGCTIFVKLLQMAEETEKDAKPLYVNWEEAKCSSKAQNTAFGVQVQMYHNAQTGERVHMCWIDAGKELTIEEDWCCGGEELFVISGSILASKHGRGDNEQDEYHEWGWLRYPPGARRPTVTAGRQGAVLYRKTGHLTSKALSLEKIQIDPESEKVIVPNDH
ncbi:hypothetical protein FisN_21Hh224 [Fistulifera solaris]|uniref:ChrR-like cupin domain-containing protein n=1 Tax=Fistulifera solaris TaxID=1519565 RepID=A0A1Z5JSB6_FISSO|nr:hypothetical protein FisN_21Hh224 [Fistulifera solaris]|eukprot:GAX16776.1 hypothetical protein FisN_21Hh224 [Fistulifera solaris]